METLFDGLTLSGIAFLATALFVALGFEFINGFHDTANAVATVIYTNSLRPWVAVIWSGICNFLGVVFSGVGVAYSIVNLLPVDLLISIGSGEGYAMVFALLLSAIFWNLGTWYFGIPASSSHTLIGSILGVGIMNSLISPDQIFGQGVNWQKAGDIGLSLLVSPLFGFSVAALLLLLAKKLITNPSLYNEPKKDTPPPLWIRSILILTCTGVSFAHGSNDGQKGIGLIMLILIGIVPASYSINMEMEAEALKRTAQATKEARLLLTQEHNYVGQIMSPDKAQVLLEKYRSLNRSSDSTFLALESEMVRIEQLLTSVTTLDELPKDRRGELRTEIFLVNSTLKKLLSSEQLSLSEAQITVLEKAQTQLKEITDFAVTWVKFAVAFALGLGTMIGWKRIVITVGEKIGKSHLSYAQGAAAELVAMSTILLADKLHLPVSTTHVLSSGVAGTMFANKSGLQGGTVKSIALAWALTLPICIMLSATLFWIFLQFV